MIMNNWGGFGIGRLRFTGNVTIVATEESCNAAVTDLMGEGSGVVPVGLDTEHVSYTHGYNDGVGLDSKSADIVQVCGLTYKHQYSLT